VPGLLSHFPPKVGARQNDFGTKDAGHCGEKFWRDHSHLAGQDLFEDWFFYFLLRLKGNIHGNWSVLYCVIPFYTYNTYVRVIF
jgi:hypothetical protein